MSQSPHPERFLSASELGEYAYCRRAWWLRTVRGVTSEQEGTRFEAGRAAHRAHGRTMMLARVAAVAALLAALIALALRLLR